MTAFEYQHRKPKSHSRAIAASVVASVTCIHSFGGIADALASESQVDNLEEVMVTARKVTERLQDVPAPVTVLNAESLLGSNQTRLQDYFTSVPGLSLTAGLAEAANIAIRGITTGTGAANPTVGVLLDDVPVNSPTFWGGGYLIPDIDPSDVEALEVLRGPQGTLYGASGLGGLIKYTTVAPSTEKMSGRVELGTSGIRDADDVGYIVRGAVNLPITATFAVRASAFSRTDPGYIDNPGLAQDDVNEVDAKGGRIAALWNFSDDFSLTLSALRQHSEEGRAYSTLGLGDLEVSASRGTGNYEKDVQAYSAAIAATAGSVELQVLSGYSRVELVGNDDFPTFAGLATLFVGTDAAKFNNLNLAHRFSQEVRLSGSINPAIDWLAGAFYTQESAQNPQDVQGIDSATGVEGGEVVDISSRARYKEYAGFGSLTFKFNETFDLQVGGRYSENKQKFRQTWSGPYAAAFLGADPFLPPAAQPSDDSFTYLVTPRLKLTPDIMLYARVASGYRVGGANSNGTPNAVPDYRPDTTDNYEAGIKGSLFNNLLSFDASAYYVDWKDIQLQVSTPQGTALYLNGPAAKSEGIEISSYVRPLAGLQIGGWMAWNVAELTKDIPPNDLVYGVSGDRLPTTPKFSANFSVTLDLVVSNDLSASLGGSIGYVGERSGNFTSSATAPRQPMPSYKKIDLNAQLWYGSWSANFYVNNVTDQRGFLGGGAGTGNPGAVTYNRPRSYGMSVAREF